MEAVHARLSEALTEMGIPCHLPECRLPNILHISVPGVPSSWTLNALSAKGICVSAGSACSTRNKKDNPVLAAYGLSKPEAESSIRLSFTENTTEEECRLLLDALGEAADLKRK